MFDKRTMISQFDVGTLIKRKKVKINFKKVFLSISVHEQKKKVKTSTKKSFISISIHVVYTMYNSMHGRKKRYLEILDMRITQYFLCSLIKEYEQQIS